jgi:serine/threonine protein phosphatase PrpC
MQAVLQARVTAFTHQGAVRGQNEDTIAVGSWVRNAPMNAPRQTVHELGATLLCLVTDGMGGYAAGEEASRRVAFRLAEAALDVADEAGIAALLRHVNGEIFTSMRENPRWLGMGTTVVGILLRPDGIIWFNLGDSRLYRYRDGFLRQLSLDDVPDPYAEDQQRSHRITQALGGASAFIEVTPHTGTEPLVSGWRYLLCSDGLTDMLIVETIETVMGEDDGTTVMTLFERAMAAGGEDNVSIVMVRIEEAPD